MPIPATMSRLVRGCAAPAAAFAALLVLSACADSAPSATAAGASPQQRSPLAAPPASMMTPHGY